MSEGHQPKLHYEDFNDALHDLVQALGGYKKVGPRLWPEAGEEAAQKLRHCLHKDRREKLSPHQVLLLLRWGKDADFHGAKHFLDDDTGYSRSQPVDPENERARLQREFIESVRHLDQLRSALERNNDMPLRAVK